MRLGTLFGSVIFVDGMGFSVMEIVFPLPADTTPYLLLGKRVPREVHISLRECVQRVVASRPHALTWNSQTPSKPNLRDTSYLAAAR